MVESVVIGNSVSRSADLATSSSSPAMLKMLPVKNLDPIRMNLVWGEIARLVRLGEAAMDYLLVCKPYQNRYGQNLPSQFYGGVFSSGACAVGPLRLANADIKVADAATASYIPSYYVNLAVANSAVLWGTSMQLTITDESNSQITQITGQAQVVWGALMKSLHGLLDNTTAVFDQVYQQIHRSDGTIPSDVVTQVRASSLFSGTAQKTIAQWPSSALYYDGRALDPISAAQSNSIATAVLPALFANISPTIYDAALRGKSALLPNA